MFTYKVPIYTIFTAFFFPPAFTKLCCEISPVVYDTLFMHSTLSHYIDHVTNIVWNIFLQNTC